MKIIPAIDIIQGHCIRLVKGDFTKKTIYSKSPLDVAKKYEDYGLEHLHLVDLDGAKQKKIVNLKVLELIASNTDLIIDYGGGVQTSQDIKDLFNAGAAMITAGSIAVKQPETVKEWMESYGNKKIILGADVKNGLIAINGWKTKTDNNVISFIEEWEKVGIKYVISTDVSKDGLLKGPSIEHYKNLNEHFEKMNIIASGGVSNMQDIYALKDLNLYGVIVGKAIYEKKITLEELSNYVQEKN